VAKDAIGGRSQEKPLDTRAAGAANDEQSVGVTIEGTSKSARFFASTNTAHVTRLRLAEPRSPDVLQQFPTLTQRPQTLVAARVEAGHQVLPVGTTSEFGKEVDPNQYQPVVNAARGKCDHGPVVMPLSKLPETRAAENAAVPQMKNIGL